MTSQVPEKVERELRELDHDLRQAKAKAPWSKENLKATADRGTLVLKEKANAHAEQVQKALADPTPVPYAHSRQPTVLAVVPDLADSPAALQRTMASITAAAAKFGLPILKENLHKGGMASALQIAGSNDCIVVQRFCEVGTTPAAILATLTQAGRSGVLIFAGDFPTELTTSIPQLRPVLAAMAEWGNALVDQNVRIAAENLKLLALSKNAENRAITAVLSYIRRACDEASGGLAVIQHLVQEANLARKEPEDGR